MKKQKRIQGMSKINKNKILDVGCGSKKIEGATGIDHFFYDGVDKVHNLNNFPWPFMKETFNKIYFCHSISHLKDICLIMEECHRILKIGGTIEIIAPHFSSDNFFTDPTINFSLGIRSMNYFVRNTSFGYFYVDQSVNFKLIHSYISFREAKSSWRKKTKLNLHKILGIEYVVNKFPRLYEKFFSFIMPASEVHFILSKAHK